MMANQYRTKLRHGIGVLAAVAVGCAAIGVDAATTYSWNTTAGGNFATTTDWTPTAPLGGPTSADTAKIDLTVASPYTISVTASTSTAAFTVAASKTILDIAPSVTYTAGGTSIGGGTVANGGSILTIQGGGTLSTSGNTSIGNVAASPMNLTLTGSGTIWDSTVNTHILNSTTNGLFTISAGAVLKSKATDILTNLNSHGTFTIENALSKLDVKGSSLSIGANGTGDLIIKDSGAVSFDGTGFGATASPAIATLGPSAVNVTIESNATFTSYHPTTTALVQVGVAGNATMTIKTGGKFIATNNIATIATTGGTSSVSVTGSTSSFSSRGLFIGGGTTTAGGTATLGLAQGGQVVSTAASRAYNTATVNFDLGAGSLFKTTGSIANLTLDNGMTIGITALDITYVPGTWVTIFQVDDAATLTANLGSITLNTSALSPALYAGELRVLPGNNDLQARIVLVPEPATMILSLAGGLWMLGRRKEKRGV